MKTALRRARIAATALALSAGGFAAVSLPAYAATPASAITADPNASLGTLAFYDASGNQLTSGSLNSLQYTYAVSSAPKDRPVSSLQKATVSYALPDHTQADSQTWFTGQATASTVYPVTTAGAPAVVTGAGSNTPVNTMKSGDTTLADFLTTGTMDTTSGYQNFVQVRLYDSSPSQPVRTTPFYASVIEVNSAANTWTQVYPAPPAPKVNTAIAALSPSPASPASHGSTVSLTSTLTAADNSHPAGSVHLFDGSTDKGAVTFTAVTGAISATDTPADGTHSYKFVFTPADVTAYNGSTSPILSYTVNAAQATTTTLVASPAGSSTSGDTVTLTATVSPAVSGSVQFKDGANNIGAAVSVSGGTASTTTSALTVGSHSLTAVFTSSDVAYNGSASSAVSYTVNPKPATTTSTTLGVSPASPQNAGTSVTLTGTVTPSNAVGSVKFFDGSTQVGATQTWSGSPITVTTSGLAVGSHSLTAQFVPTDAAVFGTSTSPVQTYVVNAIATSTALTIGGANVTYGANTTLSATVTPSNAAGTVQFLDGSTPVGSPQTVSAGQAGYDAVFAAGTHSITAKFTPTSANYSDSTSAAQTVTVSKADTTTTLSSDKATASFGQSIAFTATVNKADAAGSVQFTVDGSNRGAPVAISAGRAVLNVSDLSAGSHDIGAVFTAGAGGNYNGSTAAMLTVAVTKATTSTVVTTNPSGTSPEGGSVTITGTVSPAVAGTMTFADGATTVGSAPVSGGTASITVASPAIGDHSYTATFAPSDTTNVDGSTSAPVALKVVPKTTTVLTGPTEVIDLGATVALNAAVDPSSAFGSVQFLDGSTVLGTVALTAGSAAFSTTALASGAHTLTAKFVPTDATAFASSTSAPITVTVKAQATSIALAVSPHGPVSSGTAVSLAATLAPSGATGSVSFLDGTTALGSATVAGGKATLSASALSVGDHSLSVRFVPSDATKFAPSTSDAAALTVKAKPVVVMKDSKGNVLAPNASVKAGAKLTFEGHGFEAADQMNAELHSTPVALGSFTADAEGTVAGTISIPVKTSPGAHALVFNGSIGSASFAINVVSSKAVTPATTTDGVTSTTDSGTPTATPTSELPHTGSNVELPAVLALVFMVLGALAVATVRRRRSA